MAILHPGKRYAQALFELAKSPPEQEAFVAGLSRLAELAGEEKFLQVLGNPRYPLSAKQEILDEFLRAFPRPVRNLASLLVSRGRLRLAPDVRAEYFALLNAARGIARAEVSTALPLSEEEKALLARRLGQLLDREITIEAKVDPALIGGLKAKIGDLMIDGSVRQKIETLRRNLVG